MDCAKLTNGNQNAFIAPAVLARKEELNCTGLSILEADGGYVAECFSHDILTQGNPWDELHSNVREAVSASFFDQPTPTAMRLHLVRDDLLAGGRV